MISRKDAKIGIVSDNQLSIEELFRLVDSSRVPRHIAIIMDGNRRWAKERSLPNLMGHRAGVYSLRDAVQVCVDLKVEVLSAYAFSTDNWKRPPLEVNILLRLFEYYSRVDCKSLHTNNVRFRIIGRRDELPERVLREFEATEAVTRDNTGLIFNLAVNYGARTEIVDAAARMARDLAQGEITESDITKEETFNRYLYTYGQPDPDLLIRTSGELRLSNFMLWQMAYTEFWFSDLYWPDFGRREMLGAILDFQKRDRRYGAGEQMVSQAQ